MTVQLARRLFTTTEYEQMVAAGLLGEDDRVELLDGEIVQMSPIGSRHAACVNRLTRLLTRVVGQKAIVSVQNPVRLDDYSEPEPDLAVLVYREDFYAEAHPTPQDVLLLIEVVDTSAEQDRSVKLPLYARAGIPETWLVDLEAGVVDAYRTPSAEGYLLRQRYLPGQTVTTEDGTLAVAVDEVIGRHKADAPVG
ncbi:MAG: Uma2 family endonuclease [Caldilineae bacterium]|nr:MAG: Uma2 family endonuclease [Caldilineae bacterium]